MTAGVGEDGGLHAAPIVPEAAAEAPTDAPEAEAGDAAAFDAEVHPVEATETVGAADSSRSSVTQALPMVRHEGTGESPSVRAVARRVPSALPALGRDEITDAPLSARTTADRRRRAVADARGDAPASATLMPDAFPNTAAAVEAGTDEPPAGIDEPPAEAVGLAADAATPADAAIPADAATRPIRRQPRHSSQLLSASPRPRLQRQWLTHGRRPKRSSRRLTPWSLFSSRCRRPYGRSSLSSNRSHQPSRRPHAFPRPTARRDVAQPSRSPCACPRPTARRDVAQPSPHR